MSTPATRLASTTSNGGAPLGRESSCAANRSARSLRDAFAAVEIPFVEVHLTNIYAREPERRHSTLASGARAVLVGFGAVGYELALRGLAATLPSRV